MKEEQPLLRAPFMAVGVKGRKKKKKKKAQKYKQSKG